MTNWMATAASMRSLSLTGFTVYFKPAEPPAVKPAVLSYSSFTAFRNDIDSGVISPGYKWIMYDLEKRAASPLAEQNDPWTYIRLFGQLAHASGYRTVFAPARDLADVATSVIPKQPGQTTDQWYLANGIPALAAHCDIFLCQSERDETSTRAYAGLVSGASGQVARANPFCEFYAEIATSMGTADQMIAAARSVHPDGFYLSVSDHDYAEMKQVTDALQS